MNKLALATALVASLSYAHNGWYGSLHLGRADMSNISAPANATQGALELNFSHSVTGGLGFGYQWTQHDDWQARAQFDVETYKFDLDAASVNAVPVALSGEITAHAFTLSGLLDYYFHPKWFATAGLGYSVLSSDVSLRYGAFSATGEAGDHGVHFQVGVSHDMSRNWRLGLNWRHYNMAAEDFTEVGGVANATRHVNGHFNHFIVAIDYRF